MGWLSPSAACVEKALAVEPPDGMPRGREGDGASVELFAHAAVDRALTRCHPLVPFVLYLPFIAWLNRAPSGSAREGALRVAAFALGWLVWTLAEYLLHRFGLHLPGTSPAARVARFMVHGHHHASPGARDRLVAMPFQSAMMFALLAPVLPPVALSGSVVGYLFYELAHFQAHHGRRAGLLRGLQRHHLRHHHGDDGACFGISTRLWDYVFRTHRAREDRTARS